MLPRTQLSWKKKFVITIKRRGELKRVQLVWGNYPVKVIKNTHLADQASENLKMGVR